jgi:hypothetical protein
MNGSTFQRGEQWLLPLGVLEEDDQVMIHARLIILTAKWRRKI